MRINSSIRNKLIFAIFLGCLIPYILGGIYLKSYTEKWLYHSSTESNAQFLQRESEIIDQTLINGIQEEINMLSYLDSVQNAKHQLQNYTDFDRNNFRYQPSDVEKDIEEHFRLFQVTHKVVNFVFLGTEDGGYMEYPRFQAAQAYEPRLRPWYQYAIHSKDVKVSEPYLTKITGDMVVGFTKRVIDNAGQGIGVLGVTVNLSDLTTSLNNTKIGDSGYIL